MLVLSREPSTKGGGTMWLCLCDCGKHKIIWQANLRLGRSRSCGCIRSEQGAARFAVTKRTHGMSASVEYKTWASMINRCTNTMAENFTLYGGRGITVCETWRASFEAFFADMGPRPSARHSIERTNNEAGYSPGNCVWALPAQQANNRRNTILIDYGGEQLGVAALAVLTGIPRNALYGRLKRGLSGDQLIAPIRRQLAN